MLLVRPQIKNIGVHIILLCRSSSHETFLATLVGLCRKRTTGRLAILESQIMVGSHLYIANTLLFLVHYSYHFIYSLIIIFYLSHIYNNVVVLLFRCVVF